MTANAQPASVIERLRYPARVAAREAVHLAESDAKVFAQPMTPSRAGSLGQSLAEAEPVEAFTGRFARLQDTLGDKLLPALLVALAESPGLFLDNLNRAERMGWVQDAQAWLRSRRLRNQMVHEYVESPEILSDSLNAAHAGVPLVLHTQQAIEAELARRGWLGSPCGLP